ncbi:hypothetical protein JG687_00017691 [Phytophthora cactorum]|uniref:Uncharacterized protein n=1 Tax=Phytophthora cactorum TaxID=29920 RepID=A0A8T1TSM0_9STRA|nr:hypothetical protein JG687_00017691 [Phytophthora cactorum]
METKEGRMNKETYQTMIIERLLPAPPNSPDLNALDLGIFTAIQSRQMLRSPHIIDKLVDSVSKAYWELPHSTLNAAFLSLQASMDSCIKDKGGNNFKPRHMPKSKLEREGRLPISIRCSDDAELVLSQL